MDSLQTGPRNMEGYAKTQKLIDFWTDRIEKRLEDLARLTQYLDLSLQLPRQASDGCQIR